MLTRWKLKDKLHKELMRSIQKTPYVTISVEHIKEVLQIFPLVRKASTEFLIFFLCLFVAHTLIQMKFVFTTWLSLWFMQWASIFTPTDIYLFTVKNRNIRKMSEICSKLTIKILERYHWRRSGVSIVNYEHISRWCFLG